MKKNATAIFLFLIVCTASVGLLLFPKEISHAVHESLSTCVNTLLPTLFPFLVLSGFLVKSKIIYPLEQLLEPFMRPLFHLSGVCASPLLIGLIGGYPTGARTAVALYRDGLCSRREAEQLLAFCNNCGPGFILGSIGCCVFYNISCGILLFLAHSMSAVLIGLLLTATLPVPAEQDAYTRKEVTFSLPTAFVASVTEAMHAFIDLSAFVLCFSALTQLLQLSGLLHCLSSFLPFSEGNNAFFLLGLFEMTAGVLHLSIGSTMERAVLASALVGWGGFSVHCQVLSLIQGTDLSPKLYFKGKFLHGLLAAILTALFFQNEKAVYAVIACIFLILFTLFHFRKKEWKKSGEGIIMIKKKLLRS